MNCVLTRNKSCLYGIYGDLKDESGKLLAVTLEHAYIQPGGSYAPKLPAGTYTCLRGTHELSAGIPFETFEITNVPGHIGILFHVGNYNNDSSGCVLLGSYPGRGCILDSKQAFEEFMLTQAGINSFLLVVA